VFETHGGPLIPASLPEFFEAPLVADDGAETIGYSCGLIRAGMGGGMGKSV
jgi:hypothetical protein